MTQPTLLILGAGRYNVPCLKHARACGFRTLVADRNPNAPGLAAADIGLSIDLFDREQLLEVVRYYGGVDGIVSMAEPGVVPAAQLAETLQLPSIPVASARRATSKAAMRRCWEGLGDFSVPYRVVNQPDALREALGELGDGPYILKPDRSFGGSRGVLRVEHAAEAMAAFSEAQERSLDQKSVVVEQCVEGIECSCEVLIWDGETSLLCIGENIKSPRPYRVNLGLQYPARFTADQETTIGHMCRAAVQAVGLTQGVAHIEFSWTQRGPVLIELGARCGGGHIPLIARHVSGVDQFLECCRMACGLAPRQWQPTRRWAADYRFPTFPPGEVARVYIPPDVRLHPDILDVEVTVGPGDCIRPLTSTTQRTSFVVATARDRDAAIRLADDASSRITVEYSGDSPTQAAGTLTNATGAAACETTRGGS